MNYQRIYDQLIERARNRVPEGYVERHHVKPVCMGGSDERENLVALYPEEHFVAHILLVKMYPDQQGLIAAVSMMCAEGMTRWKGKRKRKMYGWLRRKHAAYMKEIQSGSGNSQFGTMWICNIESKENRKIPKGDLLPSGWIPGRNKWKPKWKKPREVAQKIEVDYSEFFRRFENGESWRTLAKETSISHVALWGKYKKHKKVYESAW